jgi:regulator of replication initiation timing
MSEFVVKLTWDGEVLGEDWMNLDNFKLCLYSPAHTHSVICDVRIVNLKKMQEENERLLMENKKLKERLND